MSALPFGVSQFTTWPLTFEQDLALLKREGIGHLELCEGKLDPKKGDDQLRAILHAGLDVSTVQPALHSLFPDAPRPLPRSPKERMARLKKTIRRMGKFFPGTTVVSITGAAPKQNYADAYKTAAREYREAAIVAAGSGVRLAVEPLNPILMNIDTFISSTAHAERIVDAVGLPSFGYLIDLWHVWEEAGLAATLRRIGPKIFGVHINDWHTPRAVGDRLLPGAGEIPVVPLLSALKKAGYRGAYTLEIFSETRLPGSLWKDPDRTVREGKRAFENLWKKTR